jgi:hypothetical protein
MNMTFNLAARHAVRGDVVESRLGDETVILHLTRGVYLGLDAVGTVIWDRLQAGDTPASICAHIRETFEGTPEALEEEVSTFLQQLLENELIEPR